MQFKQKVESGDQWDYQSINFSYSDGTFEEETIQITCLSADTLVSTLKGNFSCRVFGQSRNSGEDVFKYYLAENVGIVKTEHYELGRLFSKRQLIDYKLLAR